MSKFKTISHIGIIIATMLLSLLMLLWSCKKNETVEPEPLIEKPTVSGEYDNLTTGINTTFEINDTIYAKGTGKIAESRPWDGFTKMGIALYDGSTRIVDIVGISTGKQLDITVEGSAPVKESRLEEKQYTIKLDYTIIDSNGNMSDHQLDLGTVTITAEKDYEFDQLYGDGHVFKTIKAHTDEFAKILSDRGDVSTEHGTIISYDAWSDGFSRYIDGDDSNIELKNMWMTDKGDMHAGVLYIRRSDNATGAYFIGDEKTVYLIREFFEKYK